MSSQVDATRQPQGHSQAVDNGKKTKKPISKGKSDKPGSSSKALKPLDKTVGSMFGSAAIATGDFAANASMSGTVDSCITFHDQFNDSLEEKFNFNMPDSSQSFVDPNCVSYGAVKPGTFVHNGDVGKLLKKGYAISQEKAAEFASATPESLLGIKERFGGAQYDRMGRLVSTKPVIPASLPTKIHIMQAARVYAAIGTLLYASISVHNADDLERFILKKATQLPQSVFDLGDWRVVLNAARQYRTAAGATGTSNLYNTSASRMSGGGSMAMTYAGDDESKISPLMSSGMLQSDGLPGTEPRSQTAPGLDRDGGNAEGRSVGSQQVAVDIAVGAQSLIFQLKQQNEALIVQQKRESQIAKAASNQQLALLMDLENKNKTLSTQLRSATNAATHQLQHGEGHEHGHGSSRRNSPGTRHESVSQQHEHQRAQDYGHHDDGRASGLELLHMNSYSFEDGKKAANPHKGNHNGAHLDENYRLVIDDPSKKFVPHPEQHTHHAMLQLTKNKEAHAHATHHSADHHAHHDRAPDRDQFAAEVDVEAFIKHERTALQAEVATHVENESKLKAIIHEHVQKEFNFAQEIHRKDTLLEQITNELSELQLKHNDYVMTSTAEAEAHAVEIKEQRERIQQLHTKAAAMSSNKIAKDKIVDEAAMDTILQNSQARAKVLSDLEQENMHMVAELNSKHHSREMEMAAKLTAAEHELRASNIKHHADLQAAVETSKKEVEVAAVAAAAEARQQERLLFSSQRVSEESQHTRVMAAQMQAEAEAAVKVLKEKLEVAQDEATRLEIDRAQILQALEEANTAAEKRSATVQESVEEIDRLNKVVEDMARDHEITRNLLKENKEVASLQEQIANMTREKDEVSDRLSASQVACTAAEHSLVHQIKLTVELEATIQAASAGGDAQSAELSKQLASSREEITTMLAAQAASDKVHAEAAHQKEQSLKHELTAVNTLMATAAHNLVLLTSELDEVKAQLQKEHGKNIATAKLRQQREEEHQSIQKTLADWQTKAAEHEKAVAEWQAKAVEHEKTALEGNAKAAEHEKTAFEWQMKAIEHEKALNEWQAKAKEHEKATFEWRKKATEGSDSVSEWVAKATQHKKELDRLQHEMAEIHDKAQLQAQTSNGMQGFLAQQEEMTEDARQQQLQTRAALEEALATVKVVSEKLKAQEDEHRRTKEDLEAAFTNSKHVEKNLASSEEAHEKTKAELQYHLSKPQAAGGSASGSTTPSVEQEHAHNQTKKELEIALAKSNALTKTLQDAETEVHAHVELVQKTAEAAVAKYKRLAQEAEAAHANTRNQMKKLEEAAKNGPAAQVVELQAQLAQVQAQVKQRPYSALVMQQGTDRAIIATLQKQVDDLTAELNRSRERPHSAMLVQQGTDRAVIAGLKEQVDALNTELNEHKLLVHTHVQEKVKLIRQLKSAGGGANNGYSSQEEASAIDAAEAAETALFHAKNEIAAQKVAMASAESAAEAEVRRLTRKINSMTKQHNTAMRAAAAESQLALQVPSDAVFSPGSFTRDGSPSKSPPSKRLGSFVREANHLRKAGAFTIVAPAHFHAKQALLGLASPKRPARKMSQETAALKIQAASRGMLDRHKLWATLTAYAAAVSTRNGGDNMFVAVEGTLQGETGWYNSAVDHERATSSQSPSNRQGSVGSSDSPGQLGSGKKKGRKVKRLDPNSFNNGRSYYYFVVDGMNYSLLCGPLTETQFRAVNEDAKKHLRVAGKVPSSTSHKFTIDRVGLLATRRQLEELVKHAADLAAANKALEKVHARFVEQHDKQILKLNKDAVTEAVVNENKLQRLRDKCRVIEEKLFDSERLYFKLLARSQGKSSRPSSHQSRLDGKVPGAGANSRPLIVGSMHEANLANLLKVSQSPEAMAAIVRLQARVRAFVTRFRLRKQRQAIAAQASGVMIALGSTEQGKSGWYQHGPSYFFFSNYKGNWVKLCGPLTSKQYDAMLLEMTKRLGGNIPLGKRAAGTSLLTKCNFELEGFIKAADGAGLEAERRRGSTSTSGDIVNESMENRQATEKPLSRQQILRHFLRNFGAGDAFLSDNQQKVYLAYSAEDLLTGKYQKAVAKEGGGLGTPIGSPLSRLRKISIS